MYLKRIFNEEKPKLVLKMLKLIRFNKLKLTLFRLGHIFELTFLTGQVLFTWK
jgi:hypothetical protein